MYRNKQLLLGASMMLAVAIIGLLLSGADGVFAGGEVCVGSVCTVSDATIVDFSQGQFYLTGLRNTSDGKVQLLPIGLTSQWATDNNSLPGNRTELAAVIYKDIIYAIGGFDGQSPVAHREIFSAPTLITGTIASAWTNPISLPVGLGSMPAVIAPTSSGAYLYVLGGNTDTSVPFQYGYTSTIYYHALDTNGAFTGSWLTATMPITTLTPSANGWVYGQAVVHNGFLYVIGGYDGYHDHAEIFRASIDPNTGALGTWIQDQSLPSVRSSFASAVWPNGSGTDYLYVIGGLSGSSTGQPDVYLTTFNSDGTLNAFTNGSFPILYGGSYAHGAVQQNGQLYVTGGSIGAGSTITNVVESTLINPDGSFPFNWISTNPLPQPRKYHATVVNSGGEVYVIGGYGTTGNATNTVYHGATSGIGGTYAPSGNFTSRIIDLKSLQPLTSIDATTTLTNPAGTAMTLTLQYRFGDSLAHLLAAGWTTLGNAPNGVNVKTSYALNGVQASFVQYRAFFTTTVSSLSPMINEIDINYPAPVKPPDLVVSYMQAPPSSLSSTKVITIQISNIGQGPASPVRNTLTSSPSSASVQPRLPTTRNRPLKITAPLTTTHYFWVDVYADHQPTGVTDTSNIGCYYAWQLDAVPLPQNSSGYIYLSCTLGQFTSLWAQVDTCPNPTDPLFPNCSQIGQILESNENNNIFGPVAPGTGGNPGGGGSLFLPFIQRSP
jgi:hypothetical protein